MVRLLFKKNAIVLLRITILLSALIGYSINVIVLFALVTTIIKLCFIVSGVLILYACTCTYLYVVSIKPTRTLVQVLRL